MIPIGKLAKLATGNVSVDDALEVLSGLGIEAQFDDVPEDRKGDAFQRVAQFSMASGATVKHLTLIAKDGSRAEAIFVARAADQSNTRSSKKVLDFDESSKLALCQSA